SNRLTPAPPSNHREMLGASESVGIQARARKIWLAVALLLAVCTLISGTLFVRFIMYGPPSRVWVINECGEDLATVSLSVLDGEERLLLTKDIALARGQKALAFSDVYDVFIKIEWTWHGQPCTYKEYQ